MEKLTKSLFFAIVKRMTQLSTFYLIETSLSSFDKLYSFECEIKTLENESDVRE